MRVPPALTYGLVALVAAGGVLYQFFGLRAVRTGRGYPMLRFVVPPEEQAARIEQHRALQRAMVPPPAVTAGSAEAAAAAAAPPGIGVPSLATKVPPAAATAEASTGTTVVAGGAPAPIEAALPSSPDWTDFRGPRRDGEYRAGQVLATWPKAGVTPLWKQPAGGGYASFAVAKGRAFTIEQRGRREVVAGYDVRSGRELWTSAWDAEFRESLGGDGPRATPTWYAGLVYALGALGELRALEEATGRLVWRTNILSDAKAENLAWGMAAAPLIVDGAVVVHPGGPDGHSVVAYDRLTGAHRWSALNDQAGYASPMLVTFAGVRQILVFTALRVLGLAPDGSRVLWEHPWKAPYDVNAAQPLLLGDNRLFISSGYGVGAAVLEVTSTPQGLSAREVWRNMRMKNRFASSVVRDGIIYGFDESILGAIDAATGELKWKGGRYGYGQLLLVGEHLIVLSEDGELALVRATPNRFEEVARFPVLDGKTWNVPALSNGYLLVRNLAEMAAFDLRAGVR